MAAVVGLPATDDAFAFVCTGTWALAGVELSAPIITDQARKAGFSNEVGIDGTIRFLRNVTGFWLPTANACGLPTVAGPTEAASWGNVLVQARALDAAGGSMPELRSLVRQGTRLTRYLPEDPEQAWERADEIVLSSRDARS